MLKNGGRETRQTDHSLFLFLRGRNLTSDEDVKRQGSDREKQRRRKDYFWTERRDRPKIETGRIGGQKDVLKGRMSKTKKKERGEKKVGDVGELLLGGETVGYWLSTALVVVGKRERKPVTTRNQSPTQTSLLRYVSLSRACVIKDLKGEGRGSEKNLTLLFPLLPPILCCCLTSFPLSSLVEEGYNKRQDDESSKDKEKPAAQYAREERLRSISLSTSKSCAESESREGALKGKTRENTRCELFS